MSKYLLCPYLFFSLNYDCNYKAVLNSSKSLASTHCLYMTNKKHKHSALMVHFPFIHFHLSAVENCVKMLTITCHLEFRIFCQGSASASIYNSLHLRLIICDALFI